jgi:hypothetical protein
VTFTGADAMPLAMITKVAMPLSMGEGGMHAEPAI